MNVLKSIVTMKIKLSMIQDTFTFIIFQTFMYATFVTLLSVF
jgi:hypothetical protein